MSREYITELNRGAQKEFEESPDLELLSKTTNYEVYHDLKTHKIYVKVIDYHPGILSIKFAGLEKEVIESIVGKFRQGN